MATLKSIKNKYLQNSDGDVLGVTTNTENISALSFKLATADSLSKFNMVDGMSDDYNDATGVDDSASTNDSRDSANYYKGVAVTTPTATGGTITTSGDYKIHTFNTYFSPAGEEVHQDNAQKKFGTSSLYTDGTSDDYIYSNAQANFNLSGDFTIEMWVRLEAVNKTIVSSLSNSDWNSASTNDWILFIDAAGYLAFNVKGVGAVYGTSDTRNLNTWQHFAVVRNSGTTTIYVDGTSYISGTGIGSGAIGNSGNTITFARAATNLTGTYQGWIDEFRMSNTARWTANFTPATSAYTSDQYTLCLMHFDNNTAGTTDNNRNFTVDQQYTNSHAQDVDILIVAGGGGGGGAYGGHTASAGGGGAGGMLEGSSITMNSGTYGIAVGGAGAGGAWEVMPSPHRGYRGHNGGNSIITNGTWGTATADGGGGGGQASSAGGIAGGSGGAGAGYGPSSTTGGAATQGNSNGLTGYGNSGGGGGNRGGPGWAAGGGGGGAGGAGANGVTSTRGANGPGRANSISGGSVTYAVGGESQNSGGNTSGADATNATGSGGQGARMNGGPATNIFGGRGGSGILIIKRPTSASEPGNLTLVSNTFTAQAAPTTTRIVLDELTSAGGTTLNTDLKAYASRDNGTTYTQMTLADQGYTNPNAGIDGYTKLLLHCDGSNNGTTFTDSSFSGHTVTANGNAVTDTTYKKFGTAGYKCSANGDTLNISDSDDWNFGSGDFTIDCWLYRTGASLYQTIVSQQTDSSNYWQWRYWGATGNFDFNVAGAGGFTVNWTVSAFAQDTWVHHQIVRNGSSWYLFQNGTQVGGTQTQAGAVPNMTGELMLQGGSWMSQPFVGYMDEFRISKGIARNTSNFVVPSAEYTQSRRLLSGSVDISGQPAGTNMKYKIETLNQASTKQTRVYGTSMAWA